MVASVHLAQWPPPKIDFWFISGVVRVDSNLGLKLVQILDALCKCRLVGGLRYGG